MGVIGIGYFFQFLFADSVQIGMLDKDAILLPLLFIIVFSIFIINFIAGIISYILSNGYSKK
ncbi:hypothetical protein [Bernardetia sp.]|uniref:hypothetical protein n=1 Tax=Bernardetia sp. TaxID=1937974 RepID=UPI0025BB85C9|nr:hypothetical protein [Bernardetia sp.]